MTTLETLQAGMAGCEQCALHRERKNIVFGVGPATAKVMLVGEGPGQHEDEQGEPFVGPAGALLNRILKDAGASREAVYIANVVKCRPPGNRDPEPDELRACGAWLRSQIEVIQPKVLIGIGRFATTRLSGQWGSMGALLDLELQYEDRIPVIPSYHPAFILRKIKARSPDAKEIWKDTLARFRKAFILASQ
jgi:DNA polymerase